jgi:epoxyqueuosine reductase QueG
MKTTFQSAQLNFAYRNNPVSGNVLNGLGENEVRQPAQIFHGSGFRKLEWEKLELFFLLTMPFSLFIRGMFSRLQLRHADGTVADKRIDTKDKPQLTEEIKAIANRLGARAVGITKISENECYQNYEPQYKYAISIAYPMQFDIMKNHVTHLKGGLETIRAYTKITRIVVGLAKYIRQQGWPARAYCESADILHVPLAIKSGIGELGKHGSIINRDLGSDIRLATVLTDMPLELDNPVDIAVEDLCASCRRCSSDCPVDAISDKKQLVRGVEKWYVDFDKCVPYFSKTYGCGICIQVCPWSKPGRGPSLSKTLLSKRSATNYSA